MSRDEFRRVARDEGMEQTTVKGKREVRSRDERKNEEFVKFVLEWKSKYRNDKEESYRTRVYRCVERKVKGSSESSLQ